MPPPARLATQPGPRPASADASDWGWHSSWHWQGLECHWRVVGDRNDPPLVLIHGFGAGSGHWRHNAAALAAGGWCVYGLDLIGFGASEQPGRRRWRPLDNRLWARQLQGFLEQVVGGPAVLVGHSLGGLVSLSCACFFPGWVRAVVACPLPDPTLVMAGGRNGGAGSHAGLQRSRPAPAPRRSPWRRRLLRGLVVLLCRLLPLELIVPLLAHSPLLALGLQSAYLRPVLGDDELLRVIARPARRAGAVRSLRAMSIAMALRPHGATAVALLLRLERPLLLLWGRQDRLVPLEVAALCLRLRGDLPLEVLDGAGHCPHDETPEAFNGVVLGWLQRHRPAALDGPQPPGAIGAEA